MKVIEWQYSTGTGMGFHLVQGHIQLDVSWEYGKDAVRVRRTDDGTPFKDVRTFPIPSDYRGKSRFDIANGMRDHMRTVCAIMWHKEYGQSGVNEFHNEWKLLSLPKGGKVTYRTIGSGTLLGVIVGHVRNGTERDVEFRVTSRRNPHYRCGEVIRVNASSPWMTTRKV